MPPPEHLTKDQKRKSRRKIFRSLSESVQSKIAEGMHGEIGRSPQTII